MEEVERAAQRMIRGLDAEIADFFVTQSSVHLLARAVSVKPG